MKWTASGGAPAPAAAFRNLLRSPCCRKELVSVDERGLRCTSCGFTFRIESWGPDLMPPSFEIRYSAFPTWQAVQHALGEWRKRTWDGSALAAERAAAGELLGRSFLDFAAPSGQVLDVGCGGGWMVELYRARECFYSGIDPLPSKTVYPFPFARAISDCLPFADGSFDACAFYSSIDYSLSIQETLREACRVLRPGGLLAVATPIHQSKEVAGERLHHYRFLAGELEELLRAEHMERVETSWYRENYAFIRSCKC